MLKFIFGRSGYGKTEYCFSEIKRLVDSGKKDIMLLTPEQFNFTAEKKLLTMLGESKINYVENLSFSRLSNLVSKKFGGDNFPVLSKGAKAVLMKKAISSVSDDLIVFTSKTEYSSFINSVIKIYDEMKSCNISSEELLEGCGKADREVLSGKLHDLGLIFEAYESLINGKYYDSSDDLSRLYDKLIKSDYINGKYVFIDGFNGFVANEIKLLELIISKAESVCITLCTDSYFAKEKYNLFSYVNQTAATLSKIAQKCGEKTEFVILDKNRRTNSESLAFCEKNFFNNHPEIYPKSAENIRIYKGKDISDECEYISLMIKKHLRAGVKARDVAVICRDIDKYSGELSYAFKKFEIPFFDDERQAIKMQPLMVFVNYLLRCIIYSFRSEDVLSLAKTGLTELSDEDINALENYIYLWNISGIRKWEKEFTASSKGFVSEISKNDEKEIQRVEAARKYLFSKISYFRKTVKDAGASEISEAIYNTLMAFKANSNLKSLAFSLSELGKTALADEQERIWDLLMQMLNDLAVVLGNEKISINDYYELFNLMLINEDLGVLPQGLDNVQFGQADRIRADNPKVVFILGANEGEFPRSISGGGILSETDRVVLSNNDFNLYSFGETLSFQERYFAYMAVSVASEALYITYVGDDKTSAQSALVNSVKSIFPNIKEMVYSDIPELDLIESSSSAFELMAERFADNTEFSRSLKHYFENDGRYNAVRLLSDNADVRINNKQTATNLFSKDMYISASKVEDYFNCAFRYFCKFGLGAKPREKAQMNAMETGTVIHYVLEMIIKEIGSAALSAKSDVEIKILVDKYLNQYYNTQMGSIQDFSSRFKYQFMRLSKMLYSVVFRLRDEFSQSLFEAKAFELKIDKDGEVKPQVIKLDEGSVQIRGSIDRFDVYEKSGEKYIRVIDYKSGTKTFNLADVLYGLNLQMFIYLFNLCGDETSEFSGIPAGVLYMHASRNVYNLPRIKADAELAKNDNKEYKMKGIVLYDKNHDILEAMEKDLEGKYIPVYVTSKKDLKGCFASYEELGRIHRKITSLLETMGNNLHNGIINQNPINGSHHDKTCEFCDYSDVCAARRIIQSREMESYKDEEVLEILKGDAE